MRRSLLISLFVVFTSIGSVALSQDRVFTFVYQSTVLQPGERELEATNALRWGRESYFREFEHRLEFETGIVKNLQGAFYLNVVSSSSSQSTGENIGQSMTTETGVSFSSEWKWKLADPVADPLGIGLYGEFSIGSTELELEPKLLLDKAIGRSLVALNIAGEFESENAMNSDGQLMNTRETTIEFAVGWSYQLEDQLCAGLELLNRNSVEDGAVSSSTLYLGPVVSFSGNGFWINLSVLPQIPALKGATSGALVLDDEQRWEARILISYAL